MIESPLVLPTFGVIQLSFFLSFGIKIVAKNVLFPEIIVK